MVKQGLISRMWIRWVVRYKYLLAALILPLTLYILFIPRCIFKDPFSTVITDRDDILLGARVSGDGQWRFPPSDSVPAKVLKATLAYEDRYFFYHPGINPVSLIRAVYMNIRAGHVVSGGSTISMQTIRLYRRNKPRTIPEKLIEMLMAVRLEVEHTKSEILGLYISHAPYGGNVVGLEAASWRYFATGSDRLSWAEAATLAVLPNSPSLIHPGRNRADLLRKRNHVLQRMFELGWIDRTTLITSLSEKIPEKPNPMPVSAPHLLNRVYLSKPGAIIKTTLDGHLQKGITDIVEMHHNRLSYNEIHNASAIVIEVETGNIVAYAGNCGYPVDRKHSNDVDVVISPRSTGSLLKPLLFAAMIDDGKLLPGSLISDIPISLGGFSPQNFSGQFEGAVPASRALSRSLNVPAVQLLKQYGTERFHDLLIKLGMNTINNPASYYGLSLILGGAEGTLEEMTNIYASLSRVLKHYGESGRYYSRDFRPANYNFNDAAHTQQEITQSEIFNASSIWCTYLAMIEVNRPEEETGWQNFSSSRRIAWKTGTSFGYRDGWAIGTSADYVVGVWIGNADGEGRPGLTGIATAAPVMFEIFGMLPSAGWFKQPLDEMVPAVICHEGGYLAGPYCARRDTLKIPMTGLRSQVCPFHKLVHLSVDQEHRVTSDCCPVDSMVHLSWFILPPVQEWYYKRHHTDYKGLPSFREGCEPEGVRSMDLVYPRDEVRIFVPRGLTGMKESIVFEAVHSDPDATIYWHMDDRFIATTKFIHQVELSPGKGTHRIVLVDEKGEELIRKFEVVEP